MKLSSARVREFKSIWDSEPFSVNQVTCLVGKNEAGKTALLHALYRLNPIVPADGNFDPTEDYPRSEVEDYLQAIEQKTKPQAQVVEATFTLEPHEIKSVEDAFGPASLSVNAIVATKGYGKDTSGKSQFQYRIPVDEAAVVRNLVGKFTLKPNESSALPQVSTLSALAAHLASASTQFAAEQTQATEKAGQLPDEADRAQALGKV